ncbi:MAG: hypothetical protein H6698_06645 [Myxococcales bacterium]|nr:hypothetical protein [Myxococcales bacterium]MCB9533985.1 hypothetical protein [Myxococcales bacterium]
MQRRPAPTAAAWMSLVAPLVLGACDSGDDDSTSARDAATVDAEGTDGSVDAADTEGSGDASASVDLSACRDPGTEAATARCLAPTLAPEHYVAQALLYFDTLDISAPEDAIPTYAENVVRWEWPPWLLLTALGRDDTIQTGRTLRSLDPSTVPERDCRFFDQQPFARCYIVFEYDGRACPIYEEFTFNDAGEVTFVEAWSDQPDLLPQDREADPWGDAPTMPRLSTRVPGLGTPEGSWSPTDDAVVAASATDPDLADLALRATDWRRFWFQEVAAAGSDYFDRGCGWQ